MVGWLLWLTARLSEPSQQTATDKLSSLTSRIKVKLRRVELLMELHVVVVIAQQLFSYHQLSRLRKSATAAGLSHRSCTVSCVRWLWQLNRCPTECGATPHSGKTSDMLLGITCLMGWHTVTSHPTQVNTPALTPARQAGTRFTYPGGMEGWVDLGGWVHNEMV